MSDFLDMAKKRFSVRKFSGKELEQEKLDKILEAGNVAPTAKNIQPQRIYVLQSEDALAKLDSLTHIMLQASELGLATCWCNYFSNSKLEEAFEFPKNEKSVLIMPIGYADEDTKPSPMHDAHNDINEIVKYL